MLRSGVSGIAGTSVRLRPERVSEIKSEWVAGITGIGTCGLHGSLGTLHTARSATASSPCATPGTGGWLGLTRPGLPPGK